MTGHCSVCGRDREVARVASLCDDCLRKTEAVDVKEAREWATAVVRSEPMGYRTEKEHRLLEDFASRVITALRTKPLSFRGHEE